MSSRRYPVESSFVEPHENMDANLANIREWLDTQEDLRPSPEDDFLIAYLRICGYNLDEAKKKLRNFYVMRGRFPQLFANRDVSTERMQALLKLGAYVPLKNFHQDLVVVVLRPSAYDPNRFKFEEFLKVGYMVIDVCSKLCRNMQVHGVYGIFDMQGVGLAHVRGMTRTYIKQMVDSWENYHCQPKYLHFINGPFYINMVLNVFRSFMSAQMKERVLVSKSAQLLKTMDKSVLPVEYGGTDGTLLDHAEFWRVELTKLNSWLIFDEQFKAIVEPVQVINEKSIL